MAVNLSALRAGRPLPPRRFLVPIFVSGWVDPRGIVWLEGLVQLKKSNDLIGNRNRDLPACSIVPQPTTLPRAWNRWTLKWLLKKQVCTSSGYSPVAGTGEHGDEYLDFIIQGISWRVECPELWSEIDYNYRCFHPITTPASWFLGPISCRTSWISVIIYRTPGSCCIPLKLQFSLSYPIRRCKIPVYDTAWRNKWITAITETLRPDVFRRSPVQTSARNPAVLTGLWDFTQSFQEMLE
jgi:hypothetical protein